MPRTLGRMLLLSAVAVVMVHGTAGAQEESPLGRILEFQKKLNEKVDYELPVQTTVGQALKELLAKQDIPYTVNETAFFHEMQEKNVVKNAVVDQIGPMKQVTRATVLKMLLAQAPASDEKGVATYILRPNHVEITTVWAVRQEFYVGRPAFQPLPPLAYGSFKKTPLPKALAELARTTEHSVVLDPKATEAAESAVTADFLGVPLDTAVQVLADMAGLQVVRLESVYYVTSPENAQRMRKEVNKRSTEIRKATGDEDPLNAPLIP